MVPQETKTKSGWKSHLVFAALMLAFLALTIASVSVMGQLLFN